MSWALPVAQIGGSILSGIMGSNAANKAAGQAAAAQQRALDFSKGIYTDAQGNFSPYIHTGQDALTSLAGFLGLPGGNAGGSQATFQQFTETPFYQFALDQGNLAVNRQLAAQGLSNSGAQGRALAQYNQGYASQQFGNYLDQLGKLAGFGQQGAGQLAGVGTNVAQQVGQQYGQQGAAQAAGTMGSNNAWTTALQGALGALATPGQAPQPGQTPSILERIGTGIGNGATAVGGWLSGLVSPPAAAPAPI